MTNQISTYIRYADLQMAAEALILPKESAPGTKTTSSIADIPQILLTRGNARSSKFTAIQAEEFSKEWSVVEHIANTSTGFSGTLFKSKSTGELVMSLRSTEFADDSARDNQATNTLEIKEKGWAFGQIADMEKWYADLRTSGKIGADERLTVTGYSLGGHLATAFYQLREEQGDAGRIAATYTFNGAGVGLLEGGTSLSSVMGDFTAHRGKGGNAASFVTAEGAQRYAELSGTFAADAGAPGASTRAIRESVDALNLRLEQPIASQATRDELQLLRDALRRMLSIANEAQRVNNGIPNTGGVAAQPVAIAAIEGASSLDYQLAVMHAAQNTAPSTGLVGNTWQGVMGRDAIASPKAGFYDLYGSSATQTCQPFGRPITAPSRTWRPRMPCAIREIATCRSTAMAARRSDSKNRRNNHA